jgi:predicted DNA-binding protein (UPF0251 family)/predicted Fe-Mo cluster-binding NifX family protein
LPEDGEGGQTPVVLTLDEYEAVRLLDYCGLTQEECAIRMEVSRTTVTAIYDSARKKLAEVLVCGRGLRVYGGNVRLELDLPTDLALPKKGSDTMRIAVTYENGQVFQHFGHTKQFKVFDISDGNIVSSQMLDASGSGHGALATFLFTNKVDTLICGGIGGGAKTALANAGISLYGGVTGSADEAAKAFADGRLSFDPLAECKDHDGHHHHGGHACGGHIFGEHK